MKKFLLVEEKDKRSAEQPAAKKLNSLKRKSWFTVTLPLNLPPSHLRDLTHEKHKKWSLKRKFLCHSCQKKELQKTNAAMTLVAKSGANGKIVRVNVG